MAFSIQTNVNSLIAQENLRVNSSFQSQTIQRLTSGFRINQSGDDAAGLAIANKFRSDIAELSQGVRNANDGVSQLQIIDGGMNNISKMLDRLKTLATQSASDSFTGDRAALNSEYQTLVSEIDRQAQSIGLSQGGSFAKTLNVYLGGGAGSTAAATLANSTITVDLSKATVDSQSMGLKGVQAQNSTTYDLGAASATSVENIIGDNSTTSVFKFTGAGFGDPAAPISVSVNLNGVGDTAGLVDAINAAIETAGAASTGAAAKFKAADIKASISTDSDGNQMLAFSSGSSAFEVTAGDATANALMGNFADLTVDNAGQAAVRTTSVAGDATKTFAVDTTFTVRFGDGTTLTALVVAGDDAGDAVTSIAALADIDVAGAVGGTLTFTSNGAAGHAGFTITANATAGGAAVDVSAVMGFETLSAGPAMGTIVSGGSYQLGDSSGEQVNLNWVNLGATDKQSITISANDASGGAHSVTVNLTGSTKAAALDTLNDTLQATNDATLMKITAAHSSNGPGITFISNVADFTVSAGLTTTTDGAANVTRGLVDDSGSGFSYRSIQVGEGASADISSAAGAKQAVSAISAAVKQLGTAQAAVGKGQNQLSYAIGLANSQISNFSAAQAQIRDADVAAEAANLTKAQVLQQASLAAMAQANSAPQAVLALLRG
jgi:flagellin